MRIKSNEQSTEKYLQKSLMAYLEGEQALPWIVSIIGFEANARHRLAELQGYGKPERYLELSEWLDSQ
jgi:hypothetical protein